MGVHMADSQVRVQVTSGAFPKTWAKGWERAMSFICNILTLKLLVRPQVAMSFIQETTVFQHLVYIMPIGRNHNLMDQLQSLRMYIFINLPNDSDAGWH